MRLENIAPNQNRVTIEDSEFYFSYNTLIAVRDKEGEFRIESPSKTTTHHMKNMGVFDWKIVSEEELAKHLPTTLSRLTK